ncbi:DUF7402 domain-containing protein [Consotaella aegiceratis]|uniref:DUF7402 domain-containing protein n=1 Tax=Consotaella aegiceratis TaxID=3097961 RepID=UPI002F3FE9E8
MPLVLSVVSAAGRILSERRGEDETWLVHRPTYEDGDSLVIESSETNQFVLIQMDDAMEPALLFLKDKRFELPIPFDGRRAAHSPRAFAGEMHRLHARKALPAEIAARRNLAFNPYDHHDNTSLFPHAEANVETRGEAGFAARNAIDGQKANDDHGSWPYTSWGINQDPDAELTLRFGRPVAIDEVVLYLRADFPHDAWWRRATLGFSDGSDLGADLSKTGEAQRIAFSPKTVEWLSLGKLIKADDPSPFPALTQIECWGREAA